MSHSVVQRVRCTPSSHMPGRGTRIQAEPWGAKVQLGAQYPPGVPKSSARTCRLTRMPCTGPKKASRPAALLPVARAALGLSNLGAGPPGPGPLCGRMAGRARAQSKLNLHLGAPSGQSSLHSHRSPLMASSKCGAAASAPRVRAHPPSPRARCKMVFTKVNIGRGARWPPLPGPPQGC